MWNSARQANAEQFDAERFDTWVSGVPAYSTLGWFDDPLLSSFIHWPRLARAELLFHELAHSRLYLPGDTPFNESFATFVAGHALPLYLAARPLGTEPAAELAAHRHRRRETSRFNSLLLQLREQLAIDFAGLPSADGADAKAKSARLLAAREVRERRFAEAQECFAAVANEFSDPRYERFFAQPLNLARLSLVSAYNRWVGAFAALYAQHGSDLERFYAAAEALSEQPVQTRLGELQRLSEQQVQPPGNDHNSNDIHCEAFANHAADGHVAG